MKYLLDKDRCALLVIDPQERLMKAIHKAERVASNTALLIRAAQVCGVPLLATTQYVKGLGPFVPELHEMLPQDRVIDKVEFDAFSNADFRKAVSGLASSVDTLILTGVETHICVYQTAIGAMRAGFKVWVADDAVSSRRKRDYKSGIRLLVHSGAVCAPSETILFQWLRRAGTPEFKAIMPYLK